MQIRANFDKAEIVDSEAIEWKASPMKGVDRRPLDRVGDEVARATSIVRYAPNSHFSPHVHTGGEEFIVLSGVFQDEHGDYPAGSYVRNPPQSNHTPGSVEGCVIFVKLWQFQPEDRQHVNLKFDDLTFTAFNQDSTIGICEATLYKDNTETVKLLEFDTNAKVDIVLEGGVELLVIDGVVESEYGVLRQNSWLRLPIGERLKMYAKTSGARVWLKYGHLRDANKQIARVQKA